jgi:hypothetical protein
MSRAWKGGRRRVARSAGIAGIALLLAAGGPLPRTLRAAADPVGAGMDGGGCVTTSDDHRITHGFDLHCDTGDPPNSLDIDWDGNRFHLGTIERVRCSDDPAIDLEPPVAGFDTVSGTGSGRLNNEDGATAEWIFTDAGASGVEDHAAITIRKASGEVVLDVSGTLTYGNHEAHE